MNETIQNIISRRSIRKYKSDMVSKEIIEEIVKVGSYAASGMKKQSPIILAVSNKEMRDRMSKLNAKVMGNLMNAAHSLGLGSCWIHRAKEVFETEEGKEILKSLGIEGEYEGIGNCILGYPDCKLPEADPRKDNYVYYVE